MPVWIVAAGKAAPAMAAAAARVLDARLRGGVVIAPALVKIPPLESIAASHPVPTSESERAGRRARDVVRGAGPREHVLFLWSGGASSLMAVPAEGLSLADKRAATRLLLNAGTEIQRLNGVRKHLSALKGGWLGVESAAPWTTLAVSDVVGDDVSAIASGPTVADATTYRDALDTILASGTASEQPEPVMNRLRRGIAGEIAETPKPGDVRLNRGSAHVICSGIDARNGASVAARQLGYTVFAIDVATVGEARLAARSLFAKVVDHTDSARAQDTRICVVASGETTVRVTGNGKGGRNQEFALALVDVLAEFPGRVAVASIGTDGVDGPTDAAGAVVDSTTRDRSLRRGLSAAASLKNNDAYAFFSALGDLIKTGPTGTNVGDLQLFLLA